MNPHRPSPTIPRPFGGWRPLSLLCRLSSIAFAEAPALASPLPANIGSLPANVGSLAALVPKGWEIEVKAEGDLNRDGRPDVALLLRQVDPEKVMGDRNANPRQLVVALGVPGRSYRLLLQNQAFIAANDNPTIDDPFESLQIRKVSLYVPFHYWASAGSWMMGNTQYTFRFREGALHLIGTDSNWMHRATDEETSTSTNHLTGKESLRTSEAGGEYEKTTILKHPRKPLACLTHTSDESSLRVE